MKILGIVGSLRKDSYNRKLLEAARGLLPGGATLTVADIGSLPLFSEDLEAEFPAAASALREAILDADGIIIAAAEYNRGISGALKNAVDWGSRPDGQSAWKGKPVMVMGGSSGMLGTVVAQSQLKHTLLYLGMRVMGQPEVYVGRVQEKFDDAGALTDEKTREKLAQALKDFTQFVQAAR